MTSFTPKFLTTVEVTETTRETDLNSKAYTASMRRQRAFALAYPLKAGHRISLSIQIPKQSEIVGARPLPDFATENPPSELEFELALPIQTKPDHDALVWEANAFWKESGSSELQWNTRRDMDSMIYPEDADLRETIIYTTLASLQGTHVSYFFGCSEFETPSKERAHVLIFERIDGNTIHSATTPIFWPTWSDYEPVVKAFFDSILVINGLNVLHNMLWSQERLIYDPKSKWGVIVNFNGADNNAPGNLIRLRKRERGTHDIRTLGRILADGTQWQREIREWMVKNEIPADRQIIYGEPYPLTEEDGEEIPGEEESDNE
ncbi:hypothetical protein BDN72DRAFT_880419 [Pluteus cervinus]|uniref:Uncharacterized protein n=1 Tax=Pluteus cervinus TaxID=181527 RepID=A0ACD3AKW1_9AGAR|nr:hypothetical protein BDN72DRAFT_880419 [Pluteus cervinus]